jgi:hypothetical protein
LARHFAKLLRLEKKVRLLVLLRRPPVVNCQNELS